MKGDSANALDLFSEFAIQTTIKEGKWHDIRPTNSIGNDAPIEIEISGRIIDFIDLALTYVKTKMQVTSPDELAGYTRDAQVAPINNLLHGKCSKVDVDLNGTTVGSSGNYYPHKAYLETLETS